MPGSVEKFYMSNSTIKQSDSYISVTLNLVPLYFRSDTHSNVGKYVKRPVFAVLVIELSAIALIQIFLVIDSLFSTL